MNAPDPHTCEFDDFRVDAVRRVLLRRGEPVPLTPKVFDTLLYFVRNRGKVLGKEVLMGALWPDAFVEENNLTQSVSSLRRALGEAKGENRYIVTIPIDETLRWLDKAFEQRDAHLIHLGGDPRWDSLRADSRFQNLVRRVGLAR